MVVPAPAVAVTASAGRPLSLSEASFSSLLSTVGKIRPVAAAHNPTGHSKILPNKLYTEGQKSEKGHHPENSGVGSCKHNVINYVYQCMAIANVITLKCMAIVNSQLLVHE